MLSEINKHEKDIVEFDEPTHKYKVGDHIFATSVTQFVHLHFPKFDEDDVCNNILKSNKMKDPFYKYYGMTKSDILDSWDVNKKFGTELHALIEDYYNGNGKKFEEVGTIEYQYFLNFTKDYKGLKAYRTEFRLFSFDLDIAGSIDLLVKNRDGTFTIVDWKRAASIDTSTAINRFTKFGLLPGISHIVSTNLQHYNFQLNVYRYILQSEYGFVISSMHLVIFHPNNKSGNYEIHDVPIMDAEMNYIMNIRLEKVKTGAHLLEVDH